MRIVSQDGCWDFPYGKVGIHAQDMGGKWKVHAFGIDGDDECAWKMAEYEDEVTAKYVCQMMRRRAEGITRAFDEDSFCFPQDSDVLRNDAVKWRKAEAARREAMLAHWRDKEKDGDE